MISAAVQTSSNDVTGVDPMLATAFALAELNGGMTEVIERGLDSDHMLEAVHPPLGLDASARASSPRFCSHVRSDRCSVVPCGLATDS